MKFDRIRSRMDEADLDVLVATSFENVAYLSGAVIITQRQIPERLAAVVVPRRGEPVLVVCTIEESLARRDSRIPDIRGYVEFSRSPVDLIAEVIQETGSAGGRIGIETQVLSVHYFRELERALPGATFQSTDDLLAALRMVKQPEEIALLEKAALATDSAIRAAYEKGRAGVSDTVIANALVSGIQFSGADSIAFLTLGSGPSAALAHPAPMNRVLEAGDVVRCDVGGYYRGYYSDLARTAVVGEPTPEQADTYRRLWQIHEETIAAVRPGVTAGELFATCRAAFDRQGLQLNLPHIGHSLGLGLHERPMLTPFNETPLQEGMVLAIEPVHRFADGTIFHVEDLVEVTADGGRVLSRSADWSDLFVMNGAYEPGE